MAIIVMKKRLILLALIGVMFLIPLISAGLNNDHLTDPHYKLLSRYAEDGKRVYVYEVDKDYYRNKKYYYDHDTYDGTRYKVVEDHDHYWPRNDRRYGDWSSKYGDGYSRNYYKYQGSRDKDYELRRKPRGAYVFKYTDESRGSVYKFDLDPEDKEYLDYLNNKGDYEDTYRNRFEARKKSYLYL